MCDYGRLNYKWIGRADRLKDVLIRDVGQASSLSPSSEKSETGKMPVLQKTTWTAALSEIAEQLKRAAHGSVAIIASARQTNEELWLLKKLADKFGAMTDSVGRFGEGDKLLLNADRNPNKTGARLIGICQASVGIKLMPIAEFIRAGKIKTLIVFGEDVTKNGIGADLLGKLDTLIVSDILPNETTKLAHYLLPGCAHVEKRGTFTNAKGRVQKFMKAVEAPGDARPEWEFLHDLVYNVTGQDGFLTIEGLFNEMAKDVPAFNGLAWASLGDTGVTVKI
jgi:NADH-quinone oxidoreductase subunit G